MLTRRLEPEVMDSPNDARDYDTMDHAEVNRRFVDDLLEHGHVEGEVLDLGVGTAQIPVELCRRCERCRLLGVDLAETMLHLGRSRVEAEELEGRIALQREDAKRLTFPSRRFDAVISNSIVHHLPEPEQVFSEAARVVRRRGLLFFRDLLRPPDEATLEQLVSTYAGSEPDHARQLFEDSLRAALTVDEVREIIVGLGFDQESVQTTSDRHWTWITRMED